jgi:hypothetical protein
MIIDLNRNSHQNWFLAIATVMFVAAVVISVLI